MKTNLLFCRREYKKDIYDAISQIVQDFPILKKAKITIHVKPLSKKFTMSFATALTGYGKIFKTEIKLNSKDFSAPYIKLKLRRATDSYYESVKDIIWHELGHALQPYFLIHCYNLSLQEYRKRWRQYYEVLCEMEENEIYFSSHMNKYLLKYDWDKTLAVQYLGRYAIENSGEFIPECFNNYYRLKNRNHLTSTEQILFDFVKEVVFDYSQYTHI